MSIEMKLTDIRLDYFRGEEYQHPGVYLAITQREIYDDGDFASVSTTLLDANHPSFDNHVRNWMVSLAGRNIAPNDKLAKSTDECSTGFLQCVEKLRDLYEKEYSDSSTWQFVHSYKISGLIADYLVWLHEETGSIEEQRGIAPAKLVKKAGLG